MSAYLPSFLPDELLYSLLARVAYNRAAPSAAAFAEEVFGNRHAVASFDLPGNLKRLVSWLPHDAGLNVSKVISDFTLFPYYAAYASRKRRAEALEGMQGSTAGVHTRFGIAAFRIPPVKFLRFCQACNDDCRRDGIEAYWRRSHQLPGITVCEMHERQLNESLVSLEHARRHAFIVPSPDNCPVNRKVGIAGGDSRNMDRLLLLARAAGQLLVNIPDAREPKELTSMYRTKLFEVGLMKTEEKADLGQLEPAFLKFWGDVLLDHSGLVHEGVLSGNWLAGMLRYKDRSAHPLCHLLVQLFINAQQIVEPPFGYGPWVCRNPLASHHNELRIRSVKIRRNRDYVFGDFQCDCGYLYSVKRSPTGQMGLPRYRRYGPLLEREIRRGLRRGSSLRGIAKRSKLDPKTIVREADFHKINHPWASKPGLQKRTTFRRQNVI